MMRPFQTTPGWSYRKLMSATTGGNFKLELFLPDDYPMVPPKIRFLTKIFHPNVDKLGRICLDVLKSMLVSQSYAFQPHYSCLRRSAEFPKVVCKETKKI